MSKILNDLGLAGGEAVTQFLGGGPALLRKGGPCFGPKKPLGEEYGEREVKFRASCLAGVCSIPRWLEFRFIRD